MANNYLIGIGGTGARVLEALVHLCAAGFGPNELALFIIDPDEGNGNLSRTKSLISLYNQCRKDYQASEAAQGRLFKTKIITPEIFVWNIFEEKGMNLSSYIRHKSLEVDLRDFASILFTEDELVTNLEKGFRGHPAIGAVVMAEPRQDIEPWTILWEDITSKKQNEVHVFLAGSVFGGTGAAGVPTIGSKKIIKFNDSARIGDSRSRILLGGALVLPYFSIEREDNQDETMYVTHHDFPIATKAALHYYNEKELGFDQLYFIGDSLNQKVGKFSVGSQSQDNQPHYIELFTALAAIDFFEQPPIEDDPEKQYFISCRNEETVGWQALPVSRYDDKIPTLQMQLKLSLSVMTTFAYAFCTYGQEILNKSHIEIKDSWYCDHFKFNEKKEKERVNDPRWSENKGVIQNFVTYLNNFFLPWACALDESGQNISLINREKISESAPIIGKPLKLANYSKKKDHIGYFLKEKQKDGKDFDFFINQSLLKLDLTRQRTLSAGNKYINLFYEAALKFCKVNYNLQ